MTVLNLPPNMRDKHPDGEVPFIVGGETVDFHKSDLPPRGTAELNRIALDLARASGVNPEDVDRNRIEGGSQELISREIAPVVPITPQAFTAQIGINVDSLRNNFMGQDAA